MAQKQQLAIDAIVIEGWFPTEHLNYLQLETLLTGLEIDDWSDAIDHDLSEETKINLHYAKDHDTAYMEFQLITTNQLEGQYYYQLFQPLSGDHPVGVTIIATVDEILEDNACQYITIDMTNELSAQLIDTTQEGRYQSHALYTRQIDQAIKVCGQFVNINIAYVKSEDHTKIYIGTPVIYQQY